MSTLWATKPALHDNIAYDTCANCEQTIFTRGGKYCGKYWHHESFHGIRSCDLPGRKVLLWMACYYAIPSKGRGLRNLLQRTAFRARWSRVRPFPL
jgi:hypothetical protein